jgi:hypothetical protein
MASTSNLAILSRFLLNQVREERAGSREPTGLSRQTALASPVDSDEQDPEAIPLPEPSAPPHEFVSLDMSRFPLPSAPPAEGAPFVEVIVTTPHQDRSDPLTDRIPQEHEDENSSDDDFPRDDWGEIIYGYCGYPCVGNCWQCERAGDYYNSLSEARFDMADEI